MQVDEITDEKNSSVSFYNSRTKTYQYKWRKNNRQKYNECCRKSQKECYQKNKERIFAWKKEWYLSYIKKIKNEGN